MPVCRSCHFSIVIFKPNSFGLVPERSGISMVSFQIYKIIPEAVDETLHAHYKDSNFKKSDTYSHNAAVRFSRVPQNKKENPDFQNKRAYKVGQVFTSVLVTTCYILV